MSEESDPVKSIAGVIVLVAMAPPIVAYQGWALGLLWSWFALPQWGAISYAQAVGLVALAGLFRISGKKDEDHSFAESVALILKYQLSVLLVVGFGFALHLLGAGK